MSKDNPLWGLLAMLEQLSGAPIPASRLVSWSLPSSKGKGLPSKPYDLLGVSRTYYTEWHDGEQTDVASAFHQIRALRDAIKDNVDWTPVKSTQAGKIVKAIDDYLLTAEEDRPVRESGVALGYADANAVRMALDRIFHRRFPLFKKPFLESAEKAAIELSRMKGRHHAWMRRGEDLYLQCSMDFRYAVELPEGHAIRVRLDVPLIHAPVGEEAALATPHTLYDGWVLLSQNSRVFLSFETRYDDSAADCIFMIIGNWGSAGGWRFGSYLTADQDNFGREANGLVLLRQLETKEASVLKTIRRGTPEFELLEQRLMPPGATGMRGLGVKSST